MTETNRVLQIAAGLPDIRKLNMEKLVPNPTQAAGPSMDRRGLLFAGLGATAASLLPVSTLEAQTATTGRSSPRPSTAQRRMLGSLEVSAIGMGNQNFAGMYGPPPERQKAIRIIRAAYERGITFFCVAQVYGPFLGEEITGEALASMRDKVIIATKFGFDISPEGRVQGNNSTAAVIRVKPRDRCAA